MSARQAPARVDLYFEDFLAGMFDLTPEERGDYFTVCCLLWKHKGRLPDDDRIIARWCNTSIRAWRAVKTRLVEMGKLVLADGVVRQPRAEHEWSAAVERLAIAQEKGRKGAEQRREKTEKSGPTSAEKGEKNQPKNSANPLNGHDTASSPASSSGFSHQHQQVDKKESYTAAAESVTRAGAREEAGASAPSAAAALDPSVLEHFANQALLVDGANPALTRRTAIGWASRYGGGSANVAMNRASRKAKRSLVDYAEAVLEGRLNDRAKSVAAAEAEARKGTVNPIFGGAALNLQDLADDPSQEPGYALLTDRCH